MIRVAAKFRSQLLACPSAIHCLIPPLCPPDTTISQAFTAQETVRSFSSSAGALLVKGLPTGSWDDCLIRVDFQKGRATAVAHGNRFFAIGLSTGQIAQYDPTSLQLVRRLDHRERVGLLRFSPDANDTYLVSCGSKLVVVWETSEGIMLHSFSMQSPSLAAIFIGMDELLCAFQSSELTKW